MFAFVVACQDVAVTAVAVARIQVEPETATVVTGQTQALSAVLTDEAGNQLKDREVFWSSADGAVADVDSDGVVSAKSAGTTRITASAEGRTGEATITVMPKPVGSVTVEPENLTLREDAADTLRATVKAQDGSDLTDREVAWTSSDEDLVEVVGLGPGNLQARVRAGDCPRGEVRCTAEVVATAEDVADTTAVTVSKSPVQIQITADGNPPYRMLSGRTMQLAANVEASDGTDLTDDVGVGWSSSDEEVATVDETGKVTAVGCPQFVLICSAMISAAVDDADGISDEIEVEVLKIATAVSISPSVVADTLGPSETVELKATPTADDGETDLSETRPVTWTSTAASTAQVSPAEGLVTIVTANDPACPLGQPVCTAGITAEVDGVSSQVDVHVRKAVATVIVAPSSVTVPPFFPHQETFTAALFAKDNTALVGRSITWMATSPDDRNSPCGRGSGPANVSLDPQTGESTTASVPVLTPRSVVLIWAESEGVVGCATLQIDS